MSIYIEIREAIQHSFTLNFIFAIFTHQYFLLIILALTYSLPAVKNSNIGILLIIPMAGKLEFYLTVVGLECVKGLGIAMYKICGATRVMRKKSVMDMQVWQICILGFVNAFGYILPTLYMLKRGKISIFEYLFKALYVDLILTIVMSLCLLKRPDLMTYKTLIPVIIALFGLAFHDTI